MVTGKVSSSTACPRPRDVVETAKQRSLHTYCLDLLRSSNQWETLAYGSSFQVLVSSGQLSSTYIMELFKSQHNIGYSVHSASYDRTGMNDHQTLKLVAD